MTRSARRSLFLSTALVGTLLHGAAHAADLPVLAVPGASGGATVTPVGTTGLKVDLNDANRVIDWKSFDLAQPANTVNFTTTDTAGRYAVLNRVTTNDPSDINGMLTSSSNIAVWLSNPAGITFGASGSFSGGSLVLTTAAVSPTDWTAAIAATDPASYFVSLTGAPAPVTDAMTGITTGAITLVAGSTITTTGGRFAAAAQSITAAGTITSTGSEAELVAATDLALPFGAGSPLGVRIDKGTAVGRVTVQGTAQINADVVRLAGASTGAQAAYLLQVDDGAQLTASVAGGKVTLAAGVAQGGVTLGSTPADVSGAASIQYDGKTNATGTGGTAALYASGDITTTTTHGTIGADANVSLTAAGNITEAASLTTTTGNVGISATNAAAVQGTVSAGGNYAARGKSLTLGTAGTTILQQAKGTVQIAATGGLLSGLDGLTVQSGSAGAASGIELNQSGTGGIVFAPGTELIGGTFAAGPPATYGFGADVVVTSIAAGQPLTLGNVHARALTLPGGLTGDITAGDIVVNDTLTLDTAGAIRLRSGTSRTGDVALTATGDVTGLARTAAATDGRLATGYDRADLTALTAGKKATVSASTAQLGTVTGGTGTTVAAGEQVAVDAKAIDVTSATAANGALRLTSTVGEVRLGTGSAGIDGTIAAATNARLGSLTARTGNASATATAGDVTGLARSAAATDGRLVAGYDRADLTAQAAAKTVTVTASAGNAQLGTISAGTGTTAAAGDQATVDARAIDAASATSFNGALRLTSTVGEVRLGTGVGGSDATVKAATSARIGNLTATAGNASATATAGDVSGLALAPPATDGRLLTGYNRANVSALAAAKTVTVSATAGTAQLGTITAGTGMTAAAGDQATVDAQAIDATSATSFNGALRLTSTVGEVRLGTGTGGSDATVTAATNARVGSLTATRGNVFATATNGDVTGLARTAAATDGRLVAGYDRANLTALAANGAITVMATAGNAQLGTATAGTGTTTTAGDEIAVNARAIDAATATASNGALRLTSSVGEVRLGTGTGGTDATVDAATSARFTSLTARTGAASATATAGDVTGLALAAPATDGRLAAGYGLANLTAQAAAGTIAVKAAAGYAQLGTITAGTGTATSAGEQAGVDARAIDVTTATTQNGALRLTSSVGEVRLGTGTGGTDATVSAATNARIGSLTARTGTASITATAGDVSGLALATPATDGRLVAGYGRADVTAQAATGAVAVKAAAGNAQLGTASAGTGTTTAAGEQLGVDAQAIDATTATTQNGALRLTSTVGEVVLGSGTGGANATVTAATNARIGSLTARTGTATATATAGDVTGFALPAAATDGRLVAAYGRADLAAQAAAGTVTVKATAGNAQLGTVAAGTGTTTAAGEQATVDAQAIDVASATTQNRALRLTSTVGEVRINSGTGGTDATVTAATSARIGSLTARTGNAAVTATAGDVTGFALPAAATDGRLIAGYGRADVAAQAATGTVTVTAAAGTAQLGTAAAGTGTAALAGEQLAVDAEAIDALTATTQNGALRLTSTVGEVRLGTGAGGSDGTVDAATNARIGSLTTRTGNVSVTAQTGDVTGLILATPATDGRLVAAYDRANLTAQAAAGTIAVKATAGNAQLGTVTAGTGTTAGTGDQVAVDAQVIDVTTATAQNAKLRLTSSVGEVRLVTGTAGTDGTVQAATAARIGSLTSRTGNVSVAATAGDVTGLILPTPVTDGRLVEAYGRADLTAQAADSTVAVTANAGYAQLGTVAAGTGTTTPAGDQIAVDARAIDAVTADARNGALRLTSSVGEVRVATGHGGTDGTVNAATNARVGDLTTRTGAISITAHVGDATGLAITTAATDSRPESGYGLTTLDAGTSIKVAASDDVQLGTIRAGTDIDIDAHPADPTTATADEIAWLGGTVTATGGHYRVTGGSVVLGAPGGISQSAGADLIVRSLAGDIGGGDALALSSGVGSTSAANQLILYSAGAIALPATSTLTAGAGQYAEIGLAAPAGMAITLGTASARRIGTAVIDGTQPTGYRVDARLVLPNPITARKIVTTADLVIDLTGAPSANLTLDEAQSTAGGINLATFGELKGHELAPVSTTYPEGLYQRTKLTAFDGVVTTTGFALLGAVNAGTGIDLFTSSGRLDALSVVSNGGDINLFGASDLRVDSVVAHGDGGNGLATLLADGTIPLSGFATPGTVRTAGDINASTDGDVTGTLTSAPSAVPPIYGLASLTATNGGVSVGAVGSGSGKGLLALDTVTASGSTAGHSDASLTGRQVNVATKVESTAGSTFVTARELGSQTQVGATITRAAAAKDVTIAIGYGTAPAGTADNGSLRFGTVQTTTGDVQITTQDGSVTGLAGTTDGLDPAHARPTIAAGGNVTVTAGRLVQLGELSGQDVSISAGDDVLADVAQQGAVTHQDGAIDIAHLVTRGALTLTAAHGATADGVSGIRIGALASGLSDGGVASTAGTTATLRTLGTLGDVVIADGLTAQNDLTANSIANIRASTLTSTTGGISLTATGGDITGLVLPIAATDGRMIAGYDRANLTTLAAAQPIAVTAGMGIAQLGTVAAGTGTATSTGDQIAVDAQAIDVTTATTQNGALRLSSTVGEVRLVTGTANTAATIAAASNARIGTLTTRTGSIGVTASTGDATGLALIPAATDGRMVPDYGRADLTAQAAATSISVTAGMGIAQLGTVTAGTGIGVASPGGIAVDARAIDVISADAVNAALRLTSTAGEVRLVTGNAGTDANIGAASNARIGTLTTRTGSILATATAGDVTGLVLPAAAGDGRLIPTYDRANLTSQAFGSGVTVAAAAGTAQLGPVVAGTGDTTGTTGGIAVDARAIDVSTATAQNATLRLTSTVGEVRLATGIARTDATIRAASNARIGTLTTRAGSIGVTATGGDVTGLALATPATDGSPIPTYGRAVLAAQAAATNITVTANAGTAQLGPVMAGTGDTTAATGGIAVDAARIDVSTATAQNAALRLTSSIGEVRLVTGTAGTDADIGAQTSARIGTLTTRTGSILASATNGDVTGLVLATPAGDGRLVPAYDRADLTSEAAGSGIAVTAAAGIAQLGPVTAGAGDTTATTGGIAVDARAIDVSTATAQNATLRLTSTAGEVRLATGNAGTDATVGAATNARLGTLTTRTGSIAVTASTGDATGLALIPAATDGRMAPDYGRAVLIAQAERTNITVNAAGIAQLDSVTAGTGDAASTIGGIAVTAGTIDLLTADARNAALKLTSTIGETRLVTGMAGTDATILAANAARIGTLTTRTGLIGVTATAGDVTGLVRPAAADDGRLVAAYDRADLTTLAAAQPIAVKAAAGNVQLGTALAGTGVGMSAGDQIAVDAQGIDVTAATAQNGALRLTSTVGEVRLATGNAGTDATVGTATNARLGTLTTRTGSIAVTASTGDATGLALTPAATDGRMIPGFGRADLTAQAAATNVAVTARGIAQLGTVRAGDGTVPDTATSGGITVTAGAIDLADANAFNAALNLTSNLGETRLVTGMASTDATILAANAARIGTLTTRTGSIAVTATAGDVTGLVLPAAAGDGRLVPAYDRAELTVQVAGKTIAVKAAAGAVQLDMAAAGTGPAPSAGDQIAVDAQAIDIVSANAQNGALRLNSTVGEVRLATGTAGTDATIGAPSSARIGTLTTRTGSIGITATAGDVTGLALATPVADGRPIPGYDRAMLTAQAAGTNIAVTANAGAAQLGTVMAGTGDTTAPAGGIAVDAALVDVTTATAQNAALRLTSGIDEVRLVTGTAGTNATIQAATNARIGTLTTRTGSIGITATAGDVTGLLLPAPVLDGRMAPAYGRAELTAQAFATNIAVDAAGIAQLDAVQSGTGDATATTGGITVSAGSIDLVTANAQNAALQLTSTAGETRLVTGIAGTDATILAANAARIKTLTTRTGSIAVTATAGDVTGLTLAPAATDGRLVVDYGRADLSAQAAGTNVTVTVAAGTAQLGTVSAGAGDTTAAAGGIAVDARAIDVATATAQNAALRLSSTAGDVRLATGVAGTDGTIQAATNARIGTLTTRTGSIAITAGADATGLALAPDMATDGRLLAGFGRADLTAQGAARNVTVNAAGTAQIGTVAAGTGDTTTTSGGIAVTAGAIDIASANAQNAALTLTSKMGETRLATGTAGTDATILAAGSARIGTLATRTGSIGVTATAGDVTGLALASAAGDGRLVTGYGRADLAALAAAKTIAVTAAAGTAQLGTVTAGTGTGTVGEQVAVDAQAIDVTTAAAKDGALRFTSTAGESRLATGAAATDATIRAATSARIGDLTAATGAIDVTATAGDVTGLAGATLAADGRPLTDYGRANLTAQAAAKTIAVSAAAGTAQLGSVAAGTGTGTGTGDQLTVKARAIDVTTATAQNGGMRLTSTAGDTRVKTGTAGTDATIDAAAGARIESLAARIGAILVTARGTSPATQGLYVSQSLKAPGAITLASAGDISLPAQAGVIVSNSMVVLRNSGSGGTLIGTGAEGTGFDLTAAEVNSVDAPKLMIDSADKAVGIGALAVAAAAGRTDVDLLGTGGFTIKGAITNGGGTARTLQIGGAAASADAPNEAAIAAGTTLAKSISAEIDNGASIDWTGGTVDLRAGTIVFGNDALRKVAVGTPESIAVNQVARSNSPLYIGALNTPIQNKVFLTALKLRVAYTGYALFQNTNIPAVPTGVVIGPQDQSVSTLSLQLYSTGQTPANSFALFGTINGFNGRTAGLLPAPVIDYADLNPRVVRITQANSRVNGCVIGSPDAGCLVTDSPPPNFQLFDERQIQLFGTADDAGLTFDPLIGTNNESLIGDTDQATLGINSIDCSAPGTRDCPATGEKQ